MVLRRFGLHRRSVYLAGAWWSGVPPILKTQAATGSLVHAGNHPDLPCDEGHFTERGIAHALLLRGIVGSGPSLCLVFAFKLGAAERWGRKLAWAAFLS